jgi:hypothetical protein
VAAAAAAEPAASAAGELEAHLTAYFGVLVMQICRLHPCNCSTEQLYNWAAPVAV